MTLIELLSSLRAHDIRVWADGERLHYSASPGALTPHIRDQLAKNKSALIAFLNENERNQRVTRDPITKIHRGTKLLPSLNRRSLSCLDQMRRLPRTGDIPLSFSQQRLWFIDQLEPGSALYNVPKAFRIGGALDSAALGRSLDEIVRRHEVLRSTFAASEGRPVQKILESLAVPFQVLDLTDRPESAREDEALRLIQEDARRPFDLARGPLLRALLVRLAPEDHLLLLTLHHIVSDGWSMGILYRELSALYSAYSNGRSSPLAELPVQYADFAQWQREWLQGEVLGSQVGYWKERLANVPVLQLPTDRPRPAVQSHRGGRHSIVLFEGLSRALETLSQKERVTLFMTLLAAFNVLLGRYSGQRDILVCTPIAGRNRSEVEGLIGFFVNTLVLRTDLTGDPTFRELLGRVRDRAWEAYGHQDLPFERLVEELAPERQLGVAPLTQVMFAFQNFPSSPFEISGCSVEPTDTDSGTARFDLTLQIYRQSQGLWCLLTYDADSFDHETIVRMLGHFQTLLEGVVADPGRRISALPILTGAEREQLLVAWNDTKTDYPKDKCIHELFEEQVERTPDAVAVVFEEEQLTYRELNARANQLAHYLQKQGVGPDMLVGLCVERSLEMIVGLLGVLKAGGAYVPLDPHYPKERRQFIVNDSRISVLLTRSALRQRGESRNDDGDPPSVVFDPRIKRVCLDRDRPVIDQESRENPTAAVQPRDLAYVIYTSGSTGTPKGVAIEHRQTGAFLSWVQSVFTQDELSGVLASTSICFDLSVFEIFAPLSRGGTVLVVQNALALTTLPKPSVVKLVNTVPSAVEELLNLAAIPESVRVINLAGEPLRVDLVRRIYECSSVGKVHDLYGPSECTTYSTWTGRTPDGPQTIGRPIANTQTYILDDSLDPVPIGIVGEIYIGGDGVARGYLNRPELTAEKFIANPFSQDADSRLYKTGDLARYLPDGKIEFLGRIDHQVKVRGFRIELGEIESVLAHHPGIQQAVVLVREDTPGDRRLVAYVVGATGTNASAQDLHRFLKQKLPEYMVPSAFVFMNSLPLTANGKLDRKALPAPDQSRPDLESDFVAARTPTEELVAGTWADILKLERVGIHDNFFELGGHSLLATQVVSRLRGVFNIELPLRALFEHPTVETLAERIETLLWAGGKAPLGSEVQEREEMKL